MKASKLLSLALGAVLLGSASSCMNSNSDDIVSTQSLTSYFNVCTNDKQQVIVPNVGYSVLYNYTQTSATVAISGLRLPDMENVYPTLNLPSMQFKQNTVGWKNINLPQVEATNSGIVNVATLTNFTFNLADRYVGNYYSPAVNISYNINGWNIHSFPTSYLAQGTTVVKNGDNEFKPQPETEATYSVNYSPDKGTCDISIVGAQFAQNMPAQNMRFKAIPFVGDAGALVATATEPFIPMLVGSTGAETPQPRFPISNLTCIYNCSTGFYIKFDCTIGDNVYHVVMNDTYPTTGSEIN